jgi:spore coat polysaccharide biosynthesis protein SpsF (cytidylyltransferase family)
MKKLIIIQSRVDSSRLPGKALLEIQGKPTLQHVIERCKRADLPLCVATTNRDIDDPIEAICMVMKVRCWRFHGDKNDVLGRFIWVCEKEKLKPHTAIIRVTADCLGIDATTIHEVVGGLANHDYSYANTESGYPPGYGCEAFTLMSLQEANKRTDTLYDREHVTPYIQRSFSWAPLRANRYDGFNLELNTEEDYQRIKNIYEHL